MERYNVANGDESAYYFSGFSSWFEADEALQFAKLHDPKAHVVKYEVQTEQERLKAELETVKRKMDAAITDLSKARNCCRFCKHDAVYTSECDECKHGSNFAWRGLVKEKGGIEG